MNGKSLTGRGIIRDYEIQNCNLVDYTTADARVALFLNTTTGSVGPFTNTRANFSTGYYIRSRGIPELMPYVTSGSIVNVSNRTIICFVFAKMICFTGAGSDNAIDIELKVNNNRYLLSKLSLYQKTNQNTFGSTIAGTITLFPGDSLTLNVNSGYFDNFADTQLQLIEFKNSAGAFNDLVTL